MRGGAREARLPGFRKLQVPQGFRLVRQARGALAVLRLDRASLSVHPVLDDPDGYLRREGSRKAGRGFIARVSEGPSGPLVLKKYRRGGALAHVLPDLFLGPFRMLADLEASELARSRGVPSVSVVGLILRRKAGLLWSGYLLSDEISGASTLAQTLEASSRRGEPVEEVSRSAIRTVRSLHDAGIVHRDLNMGNLLVQGRDVLVIDLDGARIVPDPSAALRFSNLSRLDRSYVKTFRTRGPLSHDDRHSLLAFYCRGEARMLRELESRLRAHKRALFLHGFLWRRRRG